jgi:hypothetical protein
MSLTGYFPVFGRLRFECDLAAKIDFSAAIGQQPEIHFVCMPLAWRDVWVRGGREFQREASQSSKALSSCHMDFPGNSFAADTGASPLG